MKRINSMYEKPVCPFCGADAQSSPCHHFTGRGDEVYYYFKSDEELLAPPPSFPSAPPVPAISVVAGPAPIKEIKVFHYHSEGYVSMKPFGSKNPSRGEWAVDKYFVRSQEEAGLLEAPAFSFRQRILAGLELAGQEADPERVEEWLALGEEGLLSDEEDERLRELAALASEKLGLRVIPVFEKTGKEPEAWVELPFRPKEKIIRKEVK